MKGGIQRSALNHRHNYRDLFPKKAPCIGCDNKQVPLIENDPHRTSYYSCEKCQSRGNPFEWLEKIAHYRKLSQE